jgi:ABC-type multidrug transport system ATPase subunit
MFRNLNYEVHNNAVINEPLPVQLWRRCKKAATNMDDSDTAASPPLTTTEKENSHNSYGASAGEIQNVISNAGPDQQQKILNGDSKSSSPTSTVQLLHGVYGCANPGEMMALMGSSGAGKSTLLDILADRKTTGTITGQIYFNGEERSEAIAKASAYVMQDNVHIGMLTVRETLYFAAELRLDETWSADVKKQRVDKVIEMLGLGHVQHTIVGTDLQRGISGGQLKRLSIGVEIINLPDILFLDEPTTGLDAALAFEVMASIKHLADQKRTIICTIHQPSPQTYELFHTLLLLSAGKVVYFGPTSEAVRYFSASPLSFAYIRGQNPADYVVNIASVCSQHGKPAQMSVEAALFAAELGKDVEGQPRVQSQLVQGNHDVDLAAHFLSTTNYVKFEESFDAMLAASEPSKASASTSTSNNRFRNALGKKIVLSHNTSVWNQVKVLCARTLLMNQKSKKLLFVTFMRHIRKFARGGYMICC